VPLVRVRPVRLGPDASPPLDTDLDDLPQWFVTGDGWLLVPDRDGDGGAASVVPARQLSAAEVDELRRRLEAAGLFTPPAVADEAPATTVEGTEVAAEDAVGRRPFAVHRFATPSAAQAAVLDLLGSWAARATSEYRPSSFRVVVSSGSGEAPAWPAPGVSLASAAASGCTVVGDEAAAALRDELRRHPDRLRDGRGRWRADAVTYEVAVRPLLPGESGCPDLPPA
jgi:hypothetical protein